MSRLPQTVKTKSQLKDELATAGSAKKEIAKTEKQEATIFPGKSMLQENIFILGSTNIHQ